MAPTTSKGNYHLIGAGHSQCLIGTLKEWWTNESFTNVIFFCKNTGLKESCQLRANASVLAAASPIFKTLLRELAPEEDAVVHLPDFSRAALSCVLQYIYTGSIKLKATVTWVTEIRALLKELMVSYDEETSNTPTGDSLLLRVRFRQKGPAWNTGNVIKKTVQVEFHKSGEARNQQRTVSRRLPSSNDSKAVVAKQQLPVVAPKKHTRQYSNSIDCAGTDPEKVRISIPLPSVEDVNYGSVEKYAIAQEPAKLSSSMSVGFSLSQCFARESRHQLSVKEYIEPLAPFDYDPSPLYLQKVPLKQYKRKSYCPEKNKTTVTIKRPKFMTGKVHISGVGENVPLSKDSIFADPEDFSAAESQTEREDSLKLRKAGSTSSTRETKEAKQSKKEALADLERAEELLGREQKRRNRLRRMARRIEDRIELMKKRLSFRRDQAKKGKSRKKPDTLIPCEICGKMIKEYWMKKHRKQHEAHEFCCDKCGRTFALRSRLNSHYQLQHVDISETGGFPCSVCGHVFKAKKYLTRHMTLHTGEKRYACKYCDKRFRTEKVRDNHQRTHTGEKPFVCHICQKPFSQKFNLSVHIKTHDKPRRWRGTPSDKLLPTFQCPHCPAKFRWETYLKTHMAKHTGESPVLPCELCEQVFTSFNQLRNHRKEAHPSKTILCDTCGKQFISKGCYYRHRRKHFKNKDPKPGAGGDEQHEGQPCEVNGEMVIEA